MIHKINPNFVPVLTNGYYPPEDHGGSAHEVLQIIALFDNPDHMLNGVKATMHVSRGKSEYSEAIVAEYKARLFMAEDRRLYIRVAAFDDKYCFYDGRIHTYTSFAPYIFSWSLR